MKTMKTMKTVTSAIVLAGALLAGSASAATFTYVVPSVTHAVGATGLTFVSDVFVTNLEEYGLRVTLRLWTETGEVSANTVNLRFNGTLEYADVVRSVFGLESGFGSLVVEADGRVQVGARTYAPAASGGTEGQFASAVDVTDPGTSRDIVIPYAKGRITAIKVDTAFRTNLGLFNLAEVGCKVAVDVRDSEGNRIGSTVDVDLPGRSYVQKSVGNDIIPGLSAPSAAALNVFNISPDATCRIGGIAYVIDNTSSDPYSVPMRRTYNLGDPVSTGLAR